MKSQQEFQGSAKAIISFTDSYTYNKERKQNEQPEPESASSLTKVISPLQLLLNQINNQTCKQVIKFQNLLHSLISLAIFKLGTHINQELDQLRLQVRCNSRWCLWWIHQYGDEYDQLELVNNRYGRVMSITYSTAGGIGEEQDLGIQIGLNNFYNFLRDLYKGRHYFGQTSFQPLPLLARRTVEQIEEEGAIEEIEAQMINNGNYGNIKNSANYAKAATLNRFIHKH
ncbi:MAG: hypothetical protein EZS28_023491 [Streblomastix strix]|uniref:Uncharacterized protein n=1 Tax=Streblomastix strix TaxID=222440 RepID=A0A5J4VF04_9EUKA|nr:MAG: hypothetical protein EZS28_023491 [Streblomastix strix]